MGFVSDGGESFHQSRFFFYFSFCFSVCVMKRTLSDFKYTADDPKIISTWCIIAKNSKKKKQRQPMTVPKAIKFFFCLKISKSVTPYDRPSSSVAPIYHARTSDESEIVNKIYIFCSLDQCWMNERFVLFFAVVSFTSNWFTLLIRADSVKYLICLKGIFVVRNRHNQYVLTDKKIFL